MFSCCNYTNKEKIKIVLHSIRNFRDLTPELIEHIKKFNESEKMEIILAYNSILNTMNDLLFEQMNLVTEVQEVQEVPEVPEVPEVSVECIDNFTEEKKRI